MSVAVKRVPNLNRVPIYSSALSVNIEHLSSNSRAIPVLLASLRPHGEHGPGTSSPSNDPKILLNVSGPDAILTPRTLMFWLSPILPLWYNMKHQYIYELFHVDSLNWSRSNDYPGSTILYRNCLGYDVNKSMMLHQYERNWGKSKQIEVHLGHKGRSYWKIYRNLSMRS